MNANSILKQNLWLWDMLGIYLVYLKFINHVYVDYACPIKKQNT